MRRIVVAITGASGAIYGVKLIEALKAAGCETHLIVSGSGAKVLGHEVGLAVEDLIGRVHACYGPEEIGAAPASGTAGLEAMVICPCSASTVATVAAGLTTNLIHRAADVMLKEGRPLIVVPREAPIHTGHLENLLQLARIGAVILPASPGFYHRPETVDDLVNHVVGKICDRLGVAHKLFERWTGSP
ncbi:MAG: UbiX family flavin prenyltransferase [Candidatus Tectimicrobiota bacterium]